MSRVEWMTFSPARISAAEINNGTSQLYKLTVHCNDNESHRIERQIRSESQQNKLVLVRANTRQLEHSNLVCVTVFIKCAAELRAALVKLVQHLGFEPVVRSIRWEKIERLQQMMLTN
ncbi:hypothetical protein [Solimicrobium silvestre]|uniref:MgtC-like C-terminal domain-containing protein n=1 Tax=Solimicrobium silvestre TaxID=2099400 RepID=A0A2S9H582_9BURK|nr:hypothetical protein [Solimicrobium silvestre]PRC95083.1 hypothetical protein S2091_0278 [Solimicrobium silvestre]